MYTPAAVDFRNHAVPVPVDDYTYVHIIIRVQCACDLSL